jgi:hypothetical protein|tara:strand:+ start:402 stop:1100 length:699 start_codon:yes stop_codon:yes gene_type:complete
MKENMKNIKKALISMIAIIGLTTSAFAFEGFSIGATYSSTDFSTKGTERTNGVDGSGAAGVISTPLTKTGSADIGSIFAEYTFSQGSTIGVDYVDGSAEMGKASRTSVSGGVTSTVTASAEISDPLTLYVEPTYMFNEKFGLFLKGGVTELTVTPKEVDAGSVTTSTYSAKDLYGMMTGVGAKYYMGNFFVKAEFTETDFANYSHTSTTGEGNTISADLDTEETKFSLGYNF